MTRPSIFAALRAGMRDVMGPLVALPAAGTSQEPFVVIPCILPPGAAVPLHSHSDRETFVIVEGALEAWLDGSWRTCLPGDLVDVVPNAPHALCNGSAADTSLLLVTTSKIAEFFLQVSVEQGAAWSVPDRVQIFLETAAAFGYWSGTPAEQAAIGCNAPEP